MNKNDHTPLITLASLAFGVIAVVAVVNTFASETASIRLATFCGTILPTILGYVFLSNKLDKNTETTEKIEQQTNGRLDSEFERIHKRLDSQDQMLTNSDGAIVSDSNDKEVTP